MLSIAHLRFGLVEMQSRKSMHMKKRDLVHRNFASIKEKFIILPGWGQKSSELGLIKACGVG